MRCQIFACRGRLRPAAALLFLVVGGWLACTPQAATVQGQEERTKPTTGYFAAFGPFYDGDYKDALKAFSDEARHAVKVGQARWIDSICYETMIGECWYEMGNLPQALEHYNTAVQLYVAYSDWMLRVQFPPGITPSAAIKPVPWGASSRHARMGHYPSAMLMAVGRLDNNDAAKWGGVIQPPRLYSINVAEVVRCTTLAIRRRARILGPAGPYDTLTGELAAALSRRPGPPNHWSEAWVNVQLGLALVSAGKEAQGVAALKQSLMAAGEFDHPMTSIALVELGRVAMMRGEYPVAEKYFEEATYAAFHYADAGVLEEAFRYGAMTHLLANRPGLYPPLAIAAQWAKQKGLRQLQASLLLLAAENCAVLGQTAQAAARLDETRLTIGRRQMGAGRLGARLWYLSALVFFQQKKIAEGDAALATAMNYMKGGSLWLFHISLVDNLFIRGLPTTQGPMTPRLAMDLYKDVLRDPQPNDWAIDPMESLAVLVLPHPLPYEHWFEVALMRKEHEAALEIADRARRHRFYSLLPDGGRLLSLRWLLEGPGELLDPQARLQRQDLLVRYPLYDQLSQQARAVRASLAAMPLVAPNAAALKQQQQALSQLAALSAQQEAVLREMALRREAAPLIFPPVRPTQEVQRSLAPGQAVLAFFATSRHLYGFLLNNEKYGYWQLGPPNTLNKEIQTLLRDLGQYGQNRELSLKELADTKWKQSAARILDTILKGSKADFSQKFDELIIVPDGILWHLPFEALQVSVDGQQRPLISRVRIRYVPTVSLATSTGRGRNPSGNTAVVVGRLYPRDDYAVAQSAFDELAKVLPGTVSLKSPLPAPSSIYGVLMNRLIVLDEINAANVGPFDWPPVPTGGTKATAGNTLRDWLALPWGGPEDVILPGFHTAAEDSLKTAKGAAPGSEIFLSVCGLMASGSRTILLSRWRTGGQTSYDLVREFTQELPHTAPAEAWKRAVFLTAGSRLNLAAEPRIKRAATDEPPKANHPFFWAGYLLVDPGTSPNPPEAPAEKPVLKIKEVEPKEKEKAPAPGKPKDAEAPEKPQPAIPRDA